MSMAPEKRASIAEGPALKLVHWIFTFGPIALSNQPLAFPIIGCAWVMLGNAPTRMMVWARRGSEDPATMAINHKAQYQIPSCARSDHPVELRIFASWTPVDYHRQHTGFFGFFLALAAA